MAVTWSLVCGPLTVLVLDTLHSAWIAMLAYHTACAASAAPLGRLGPRPRAKWLALVAAATTTVVALAGLGLVAWVAESRLQMTRWREWGLSSPGDGLILAYYVVVNPWVEEWFWRGGLSGPGVRGQLGRLGGVLLSVVAFWLFHVCVLWLAFAPLLGVVASGFVMIGGVAWTVLRLRTQNVWWSAVSHQGVNLGLAVVYFARLRALD